MKKQPIGMIDSGVGGLTVLKEAMHRLPNESFYYVADTAHCPYGSKSPAEIKQYVWQMVQFLLEKNIKMLVLACNTATAIFLKDLQKELSIPVIGVILPGSKKAVEVSKNQKIAVIATEATIRNGAYIQTIKKIDSEVEVRGLACPSFVELVESQEYLKSSAQKEVDQKLAELDGFSMDTLVLGCTHYPLLRPQIEKHMGKNVQIVDSGVESVETIIKTLKENNIALGKKRAPKICFFTTGDSSGLKKIGSRWLEIPLLQVEEINPVELEGYIWEKN